MKSMNCMIFGGFVVCVCVCVGGGLAICGDA